MNFLITGELGFIGRNLRRVLEARGHFVVNTVWDAGRPRAKKPFRTGPDRWHREVDLFVPCVYRMTTSEWSYVLKKFDVDVIVHNAAVVGTDVVAMDPMEATLTNVMGTRNVCDGAKLAGAKVCFMGTSVVYDTSLYQDEVITEASMKRPRTYYGQLKLVGEQIVECLGSDASVVRPLFAFGGVGDMNSLIAKLIYAHKHDRFDVDMFLDPSKLKDYLFVDDFCEAVALVCEQGRWGDDFNVAAQTPVCAAQIVDTLDALMGPDSAGVLPSQRLTWHPDTDYLGNHRLSSQKVQDVTGWFPRHTTDDGIGLSIRSILDQPGNTVGYDPLKHLDAAAERGLDLTKNFS